MTRALTVGIDARKLRDFGIGRYIEGLLRGFAQADSEDRFVVFGPAWIEGHEAWRDLPTDRFRHVTCDAPLYSVQEWFAFVGAGPRHGLDLLHFPHYVRALAPGCPVAVTIHDTIHLDYAPSPLARAYAAWMMRWSVRTAATLLTVSEAARLDLVRRFGRRADHAVVTPNAADPSFRPPSPEAIAAFREGRGLSAPFVVMPFSHRPHKNLRGGIDAFRRGAPSGWELVLPARDAAATQRMASLADDERPFRALHDVTDEDLCFLYAGAELVVVPSLAEGFGLPGLEALASGGAGSRRWSRASSAPTRRRSRSARRRRRWSDAR
jgi:glycosyltransferase involved in cell wall biosynthesis